MMVFRCHKAHTHVVLVVVVESQQAPDDGPQMRHNWLVGGGQARPLSLLVGGDSGPAGEQDTVARDALLHLQTLRVVCIVLLPPC